MRLSGMQLRDHFPLYLTRSGQWFWTYYAIKQFMRLRGMQLSDHVCTWILDQKEELLPKAEAVEPFSEVQKLNYSGLAALKL